MQFVETIKLLNGKLSNLAYHQTRLASTLRRYFPYQIVPKLDEVIFPSDNEKLGLHKVRVVYGPEIESISITKYEIRSIRSLKLVEDGQLEYPFKSTERSHLSQHYNQYPEFDEVIFCKNGLLTDAYYYNVALQKDGYWYTPKSPLLHGVMRSSLVDKQLLIEKDIHLDSLYQYDQIALINAMTELGEIVLDIDAIHV